MGTVRDVSRAQVPSREKITRITRKEVGSIITSNMVNRTPLDYNYIGSICTIFENGKSSNWNFYKKMQD